MFICAEVCLPGASGHDNLVSEGLGAFDEIEELGKGSFGTTFRVRRGDDEYAVKVIHADEMPSFLWDREIGALSRVEHPNVVAFRDSGLFEADGNDYPYLTCEYIDGGSVARNLEAGKRPENGDTLREMLTGLLVGVAEIQDLGIIHRDIKPANVALWGLRLGKTSSARLWPRRRLSICRATPRSGPGSEPPGTCPPSNFAASPRGAVPTSSLWA